MSERRSMEPQYQVEVDDFEQRGPVSLGPSTSFTMRDDPRRLAFILARYKFCAKMLEGKDRVLEVGCGDGFGTGLVAQAVGSVHGVDFDPIFIDGARETNLGRANTSFDVVDITASAPEGRYAAAYSLDVIEHIPADKERLYMEHVTGVLEPDALFVIGCPNITASAYASPGSEEGHINLKDAAGLRALVSDYFANVLMFSMNDEVVHTGYAPMAHYLFAIGAGLKR